MAQEKKIIWLIGGDIEQQNALVEALQSHHVFSDYEIQYAPRFTPQIQREFKRLVADDRLVGICIDMDAKGISEKRTIWTMARSIHHQEIPIVCYTARHYDTPILRMLHTRFTEIEKGEVPYIIWSEQEAPAELIVQELSRMKDKQQYEKNKPGVFKRLLTVLKK